MPRLGKTVAWRERAIFQVATVDGVTGDLPRIGDVQQRLVVLPTAHAPYELGDLKCGGIVRQHRQSVFVVPGRAASRACHCSFFTSGRAPSSFAIRRERVCPTLRLRVRRRFKALANSWLKVSLGLRASAWNGSSRSQMKLERLLPLCRLGRRWTNS